MKTRLAALLRRVAEVLDGRRQGVVLLPARELDSAGAEVLAKLRRMAGDSEPATVAPERRTCGACDVAINVAADLEAHRPGLGGPALKWIGTAPVRGGLCALHAAALDNDRRRAGEKGK
jgi:hypothetical protein